MHTPHIRGALWRYQTELWGSGVEYIVTLNGASSPVNSRHVSTSFSAHSLFRSISSLLKLQYDPSPSNKNTMANLTKYLDPTSHCNTDISLDTQLRN
jgi:hypothetical protein